MAIAAIVVAAGTGERFGSRKQFEDLGGRPLVDRAVEAARSIADQVVLVAPADAVDDAHGADVVVAGGPTRSSSVRAGLAAVRPDAAVIVVHDAARPLATQALFHAVVDALAEPSILGAFPGVPVTDTIKRISATDRTVTETIDRTHLVTVQTPQAFVADVLRNAHAGDPEATDDAALVEATGARVVAVEGEPSNRKCTTPDDLAAMRVELDGR